jgi:hypothetical protein
MENQNHWALNTDAVLDSESAILGGLKTCTAKEFMQHLDRALDKHSPLREGVSCRMLEPGKDWQKGKIRVLVEFHLDEQQP